MIKIFLTFMLFVVLPMSLDARRNGAGFFIGYGLGGTHYDDRGAADDIGASKSGFSGASKLYMGYKYDHDFTLEGSITNYGYFEVKKDGDTYETFIPMSTAIYLNYGHDFLHNQLRPFMILGAGVLWINGKKNSIYDSEVFFSAHYGFGLLYTPNFLYGWGLRYAYEGDWSRYRTTTEARELGSKNDYNNFLGTVYLGLQYKF